MVGTRKPFTALRGARGVGCGGGGKTWRPCWCSGRGRPFARVCVHDTRSLVCCFGCNKTGKGSKITTHNCVGLSPVRSEGMKPCGSPTPLHFPPTPSPLPSLSNSQATNSGRWTLRVIIQQSILCTALSPSYTHPPLPFSLPFNTKQASRWYRLPGIWNRRDPFSPASLIG
jgi:hypothetical protein